MTTHELKIWPEFFEAVASGAKTFDVRLNDRSFASGDVLDLREWKPAYVNSANGDYTGRTLKMLVTYVMHGGVQPGLIMPLRGIVKGYCVLGIKSIE